MCSGISIGGTWIVHRDADGTVHGHGDLRLLTGAGAAWQSGTPCLLYYDRAHDCPLNLATRIVPWLSGPREDHKPHLN